MGPWVFYFPIPYFEHSTQLIDLKQINHSVYSYSKIETLLDSCKNTFISSFQREPVHRDFSQIWLQ